MLLDTLVKHGYLTQAQVAKLPSKALCPIPEILIESGILPSEKLATILSLLFREPLHKVQDYSYQDQELTQYKNLVLKHQILPLKIEQNELLLAVSDPTCIDAQNDFGFNSERKIKIALVDHLELNTAIRKLYGNALFASPKGLPSLEQTFAKLTEVASLDEDRPEDVNTDETPVSQYIQQVLFDAIRKQASDIHFEPFEKIYQIRFRLDGKLQLYSSPPAGIARRISSRLKIIAKLNIAERRLPQDGRLKLKLDKEQAIDMRVSTLPTLWGEKIVLRVLNNTSMSLSFEKLNFTAEQKKYYLDALDKPQGMILVTGPTGSGKTVSLYTGLNYLNTQDRNISTAEDPVEINLSGINQVNINADIGLSFAATLRALLRQDPDVVMVGEIRDLETAEIAIKAAQTGHMVLSTLHTNSAAESVTRLANMGVAFYNLAASLNLIIAQRLVRKLCHECKKPNQEMQQIQALKHKYPKLESEQIFKADNEGCSHCYQGYLGRMGIYEFIAIEKDMIDAISQGEKASKLAKLANEKGMISMQESGIDALNQGITSIEELQRVLNL